MSEMVFYCTNGRQMRIAPPSTYPAPCPVTQTGFAINSSASTPQTTFRVSVPMQVSSIVFEGTFSTVNASASSGPVSTGSYNPYYVSGRSALSTQLVTDSRAWISNNISPVYSNVVGFGNLVSNANPNQSIHPYFTIIENGRNTNRTIFGICHGMNLHYRPYEPLLFVPGVDYQIKLLGFHLTGLNLFSDGTNANSSAQDQYMTFFMSDLIHLTLKIPSSASIPDGTKLPICRTFGIPTDSDPTLQQFASPIQIYDQMLLGCGSANSYLPLDSVIRLVADGQDTQLSWTPDHSGLWMPNRIVRKFTFEPQVKYEFIVQNAS